MTDTHTRIGKARCIYETNRMSGFARQHSRFCAGFIKHDKSFTQCEEDAVEHVRISNACGNYCASCAKRQRDNHSEASTSALYFEEVTA